MEIDWKGWIIPVLMTGAILIIIVFMVVPTLEYLVENGLRSIWYGTGG